MKHWLAALVASVTLVVLAPAAQAATTLTLRASATSLTYGDQVSFSGRAAGVTPGSVVKLQRKVPAGWRTVATKKVWAARTFRFRTTPPKGEQRYRVLKPRQPGKPRALSRTMTLTVQWHPTLTLEQVQHDVDTDDGSVMTTAQGQAPELAPGTVLARERKQPDETWSKIGEVTVDSDHGWSDTFASGHDWEVRYAAGASGARLAASTAAFTVDGSWSPTITVDAVMDDLTAEVTVTGSTTGLPPGSLIQRQVKQGDEWVDHGWPVELDDDGSFTQSFPVTLNADHRYRAAASGPRHEATSTAFSFGDSPVTRALLNSTTHVTLPIGGTSRTVVVHIDAGQTFTYVDESVWSVVMTTPTGDEMQVEPAPKYGETTLVAGVTGDYSFELLAPTTPAEPVHLAVTVSTPLVVPISLDDEGVDVATTVPGRLVDLVFEADGGSVISEYSPSTSSGRGEVSLLAPSGAVVPTYGFLARDGYSWRLPAQDGDYTLRVSADGGFLSRADQVVLSAVEVSAAVDGDPAHVTLDRPGQVAVVSATVPAGLDLHWSWAGDEWLSEEYLDPDGQSINPFSGNIEITEAGTYSLMVGYLSQAAEVDYYASTPVDYEVEVGSEVAYDQGPAPARQAVLHVPVTAGQLISLEVLDHEGVPCFPSVPYDTNQEVLAWFIYGYESPALFKIASDGELLVEITPCGSNGSFRIQEAQVVPNLGSETHVDEWGDTVVTTDITLEATQPGQVMIAEYDAGSHDENRIDVQNLVSTFPDGTELRLGYTYYGGETIARGLNNSVTHVTGPIWVLAYAGPTETGTVDLELKRTEF